MQQQYEYPGGPQYGVPGGAAPTGGLPPHMRAQQMQQLGLAVEGSMSSLPDAPDLGSGGTSPAGDMLGARSRMVHHRHGAPDSPFASMAHQAQIQEIHMPGEEGYIICSK